jgi:hypothetical protein
MSYSYDYDFALGKWVDTPPPVKRLVDEAEVYQTKKQEGKGNEQAIQDRRWEAGQQGD